MNNDIQYRVESLRSDASIIGTIEELIGFKQALDEFFGNGLEYFKENSYEENPYLDLYIKRGKINE